MWIVYAVLSTVAITIACLPMRVYGLCFKSYIVYCIMVVALIAWMLPLAYEKAPGFFHAWFLVTASLTILGVLPSVFIFKESISAYGWAGVILCSVGGYLIANY